MSQSDVYWALPLDHVRLTERDPNVLYDEAPEEEVLEVQVCRRFDRVGMVLQTICQRGGVLRVL